MVRTKRFLYVEDDPQSRQVMEYLLVRNMQVGSLVMFEDSRDFIPRVNALDSRPDVILLDIHVGPHNGFDMLRMLRADPRWQQARVIALTASVMNDEVRVLRDSGFDGVIAKPVRMSTFPELLERVLRGEPVWHVA